MYRFDLSSGFQPSICNQKQSPRSVHFSCSLQVPFFIATWKDHGVTNHGDNMIESQPLRQQMDGNENCNYEGQLKRRRGDFAPSKIDGNESCNYEGQLKRRQVLARGPVSMSEIRIQDALYSSSPMSF